MTSSSNVPIRMCVFHGSRSDGLSIRYVHGTYVANLRVEGLLHLRFVRSTVAPCWR